MNSELDQRDAAFSRDEFSLLLAEPALKSLEQCCTDSELREWLSLLVAHYRTTEYPEPRFLDDTLETLRRCIANVVEENREAQLPEGDIYDSAGETAGPLALELLLSSLDLIAKSVLKNAALEMPRDHGTSEASDRSAASKAAGKHASAVRSTASTALRLLSGLFSADDSSVGPATSDAPSESALHVLLHKLPCLLQLVADAYRANPALYRRCKSFVNSFLAEHLTAYSCALCIASADISEGNVLPTSASLGFLESIIKLSTGSDTVPPAVLCACISKLTTAIALEQAQQGQASSRNAGASQSILTDPSLSTLPRAGLALSEVASGKASNAPMANSKALAAEHRQSALQSREQRRVLAVFLAGVSAENLKRLQNLHGHALTVLQLWIDHIKPSDLAADEMLSAFSMLMDATIRYYREPVCPLLLLQAVQSFVHRCSSERAKYPLTFLDRIRAAIETVIGIAGEDWQPLGARDPQQTQHERSVRLAFSSLGLEFLTAYAIPLVEAVFREDKTMRRKLISAISDVALRILKAPSPEDPENTPPAIVRELTAALDPRLHSLGRGLDAMAYDCDIQIYADVAAGWRPCFEGDLQVAYKTRAALLIYKLLEPSMLDDFENEVTESSESGGRSQWRVKDLQERLVSAFEDIAFFRSKNRMMLLLLGQSLGAIFRHSDSLQIALIGESSTRNQSQSVTTAALFQARDVSADEARSLRRIAFILFHSRVGEFTSQSRSLLRRIESDWRKNDAKVSAACFLLLRVMLLRFPPEHLLGSRATLLSETLRILRGATGEPIAALGAIKFVDQLLLLNMPEFSYALPMFLAIEPYVDGFAPEPLLSRGIFAENEPFRKPAQSIGTPLPPYAVGQSAKRQGKPILVELAAGVEDFGDALPPEAGRPIRIDPQRFLRSRQNHLSVSAKETPQSSRSVSPTEALRALRSYARALCERSSNKSLAYAVPCMMEIEHWIESEFLTIHELWKEILA
jgi:hypothetical protein